ncbi:5'-nucleotidase [Streptomyces sp. NBRC 110611]|uniref:hypothetical protein n=1 Tax=Streptomyces sp. NBRC 110611 TaxID=1621259 RepID=UPI000857832B|nr:hypothetical protein [Streptomyces sp. NBRC 110611]GAU70564.1 5'-nucleotidase [Streptomyces sp. NBRC 110611]
MDGGENKSEPRDAKVIADGGDQLRSVRTACFLQLPPRGMLSAHGPSRPAQEQAQAEHADGANDGANEEQHSGGTGDVVAEDHKGLRELVGAACVSDDCGHADDDRGHQEDEAEDHDHDALRRSTRMSPSRLRPSSRRSHRQHRP